MSGVEAQQITPTMARRCIWAENPGALLAGVQPDSPRPRPGLQPGDVIEAVNGPKIANPRGAARSMSRRSSRVTRAHLPVLHDGQTKDVTIKVGAAAKRADGQQRERRWLASGRIGLALGTAVARPPQPVGSAGRDQRCSGGSGAARFSGRERRAAAG